MSIEENNQEVSQMSIEENNQQVPQMYIRRNRCFVSFPYNSKIVETVRLMANRWYTPKTREWSFNAECKNEFISAYPDTIEMKNDMIIYKTPKDVYFKFIETQNLDELKQWVAGVTYDFDGHVFAILPADYHKLVEYVREKGFYAVLRNFEPPCPIKATTIDRDCLKKPNNQSKKIKLIA
jgi:hypothetical protein